MWWSGEPAAGVLRDHREGRARDHRGSDAEARPRARGRSAVFPAPSSPTSATTSPAGRERVRAGGRALPSPRRVVDSRASSASRRRSRARPPARRSRASPGAARRSRPRRARPIMPRRAAIAVGGAAVQEDAERAPPLRRRSPARGAPPMMPASTSPVPPLAEPGIAREVDPRRPSGRGDDRARALQDHDGVAARAASARARPRGDRACTSAVGLPARRAISPGCGVRTRGAPRAAARASARSTRGS